MRLPRPGAALIGLGAALAGLTAGQAKAVDIGTGPFQDSFDWFNFSGPPAAATPTFEVTNFSSFTKISVALEDSFAIGDVFELLLNGNQLAPSSSGFTADGDPLTNPLLGGGLSGGSYFYGLWDDVALAAGPNVFSIKTTVFAPGTLSGQGFAYFSAVEYPPTTCAVPEVPGPLPLPGADAAPALPPPCLPAAPGPLPLLGVAAAFGYSRRLRLVIRATGTRLPEVKG